MNDWNGEDRRAYAPLTEEQVEHIAEKAAEIAFRKVYEQVGKGVISRMLWIVGACVIGVFIWLGSKGAIAR